MFGYAWYEWLFFFFFYSFMGWVWESCYVSCKQRRWVNRGFLRIPMLPIYGSGAVLMLFVTIPCGDNLVLQYFVGAFSATLLELFTGWAMESMFKVKYWDYSNQRIQFRGYICLTSTIAWGTFTLLLTQVVHPPVEKFVTGQIPETAEIVLVTLVGIVFVGDTIYSFRTAFNMRRALETMARLKEEMEETQAQLAALRKEAQTQLSNLKEETAGYVRDKAASARAGVAEIVDSARTNVAGKMDSLWDNMTEKVAESREETAEHLAAMTARVAELNRKRESLIAGFHNSYKAILRANPLASSRFFGNVLEEMKERAGIRYIQFWKKRDKKED